MPPPSSRPSDCRINPASIPTVRLPRSRHARSHPGHALPFPHLPPCAHRSPPVGLAPSHAGEAVLLAFASRLDRVENRDINPHSKRGFCCCSSRTQDEKKRSDGGGRPGVQGANGWTGRRHALPRRHLPRQRLLRPLVALRAVRKTNPRPPSPHPCRFGSRPLIHCAGFDHAGAITDGPLNTASPICLLDGREAIVLPFLRSVHMIIQANLFAYCTLVELLRMNMFVVQIRCFV
jgi:hypothetical protein